MSANLANNFAEFLKAFNTFGLEYIIVGGYAVIFHGYGRTTGDLDIWVKPVEDNREKVLAAFKDLELSPELHKYIQGLDFSEPFSVKLGDEPLQIDIFNAITGVKYGKAEKNSITYKFSGDLEVQFLDLDDLITNKMLTGRLKDQADVEELQRIRKYDNRN